MKTKVIKEIPILKLIGYSPNDNRYGGKDNDVDLYACILNKAQVGDTWTAYGSGLNSISETAKVVYKDGDGMALLVITTHISDDRYCVSTHKDLVWVDLYNEQEELNKMILNNHKKLMDRDNKGGDVND